MSETNTKYKWNIGDESNRPITAIILGMAGSGKTTLMQRINAHVHAKKFPTYIINLDPAVATIPYTPNIDIRESVKYKEVMKTYSLGPNGGILTSLNLFTTRFDQVLSFVEKRASKLQYVFLDTPGQIEVFNWSASGQIITESFASFTPTVYIYVVDTPRSANTQTFMSNMLYACSLFYKSKLPLILVFSKTDIVRHEFAVEWMTNYDRFEEACRANDNYMSNFTQSMGLMIGEFYNSFSCVGVSAVTGEGIENLFDELEKAALEYETGYKVELEKKKAEKIKREEERQDEQLKKVKKDLEKLVIDTKNTKLQDELTEKEDELPTFQESDDEDNQEEFETEKKNYEAFMKMISNNQN